MRKQASNKENLPDNSSRPAVYLALLPQYDSRGAMEAVGLLLINTLSWGVDYDFDLYMRKECVEGYEGHLEPDDHLEMCCVPFSELQAKPEADVYITFKKDGKRVEVSKLVSVKPKLLHTSLKDFDLIGEKAVVYELYNGVVKTQATEHRQYTPPQVDADLLRTYMLDNFTPDTKYSIGSSAGAGEVDLHFDAIMPDDGSLSAGEKLHIQLETFHKQLDAAIANHQHSMVVIHGVGSGKLKKELYRILKDHPQVSRYYPSFNPKYGYGATEIEF